ncbi:MAG: hypothetical protein ACRCYU_14020 [Nocardioides sp.]
MTSAGGLNVSMLDGITVQSQPENECVKCGAQRGAYQYCINCGHDSRLDEAALSAASSAVDAARPAAGDPPEDPDRETASPAFDKSGDVSGDRAAGPKAGAPAADAVTAAKRLAVLVASRAQSSAAAGVPLDLSAARPAGPVPAGASPAGKPAVGQPVTDHQGSGRRFSRVVILAAILLVAVVVGLLIG